MSFTYTPNTPVANHFPADDQPLMNANNQYIQSFASRDHQFTGLSSNTNDGTHKQITLTNIAAPGFGGASSALFANLAEGQSQLFFQNNTPATVQLTCIKTNVPSTNVPAQQGVSFLPGGMLIQWGYALSQTTVNFPVAFNAAATIPPVITATLTNGILLTTPIALSSITNSSFYSDTRSGNAFNFNWIAIGQV